MSEKDQRYDLKCKGCDISRGKGKPPVGKSIKQGDWILNHYGGEEGYLGWLALQPNRHVMAFSDLSDKELEQFGLIIAKVDRALSDYWKRTFPGDAVKRLYINYFFEADDGYHLHLRLIPRFATMDKRLGAWNVPDATKSALFPPQYRRQYPDDPVFRAKVFHLMDDLQAQLSPS